MSIIQTGIEPSNFMGGKILIRQAEDEVGIAVATESGLSSAQPIVSAVWLKKKDIPTLINKLQEVV